MKKNIPLALFFISLLVTSLQAKDLNFIYKNGENGYKSFRIPAIVSTNDGTLLAFAEARKNGASDKGDIDLVLKRSSDNGLNWSDMIIVWNDADNTCGNPAPVVDRKTGRIILLSTWNLGSDSESMIIDGKSKDTRRIFVLNSSDDGKSWSKPKEITADVKKANWTWYATGPVNGIQLNSKKYNGRLVIPSDHIEADTKKYYSHTIHSDDGGFTWKLGGSTPTDKVNECTIVEFPSGELLLNMRNYNSLRARQTSRSKDGGETWSALKQDLKLIEPICQASMIWYNQKGRKQFLAFSNPASSDSRSNLTVRISYDKGKTWKLKNVLHDGPAAYSNLVVLANSKLACLYEAGIKSAYEGIVFEELDWDEFKEEKSKIRQAQF